jgi:hypothetical protein
MKRRPNNCLLKHTEQQNQEIQKIKNCSSNAGFGAGNSALESIDVDFDNGA